MGGQAMSTPLIQPEPPDPNIDEARAFWRETGRELVRDSIKTIDETARQIIAVAGILEGLYFHAITFSDIRGTLTSGRIVIYTLPLALLVFSLITAFIVFFPERYRINILSSTGSKEAYEDIIRSKLLFMRIAAVLLVLGVACVGVSMVTYLLG
jgi:hypothetical protein